MCGEPITHAGTEQLAAVCDSCFSLRAECTKQDDLSRSASEILAYAEKQPRLEMSERRAHVVPAPYKDGDCCVWCCYFWQRPWLAPKDALNWEHEAYFRDLRITAPTTNPTKRETDKADTATHYKAHGGDCAHTVQGKKLPPISLAVSGVMLKDLPSPIGADVDAWLADRGTERKEAEKAEKQNRQYGAVRGDEPKELKPVITYICPKEPHTDVAGVTTWNPIVIQSSPLEADVHPLRVPVLSKVVGKKLIFEKQYWWTRNIPTAGLCSRHRVVNYKLAVELQKKAGALSPASPDYYAPATAYELWLSDQKPWLDQSPMLAFKPSGTASEYALELARYFSEPRDLPYDSATEQPAIKDLKYFLPSTTKPFGFLRANLKQNPRTKAWTLRRRWSENGKRKEIELYLGRPTSEEGTYIEKPSREQFVQHCWEQASLAKDEGAWLQWFCRAQALRMAGASGTDYGTEDTSKEDALQQQPKSLDTSYVVNRDLVVGENGTAYEVVKHKPDTSPTHVDDALDDERVSLGELSKALSRQEKEEAQPEETKQKQTPVAEEVKPKPRYAFRSEYGIRLIPKKLESAKVMCVECSQPRAVNRFNQQTEWMKLRCGHERFLCLKCGCKCHCKQ